MAYVAVAIKNQRLWFLSQPFSTVRQFSERGRREFLATPSSTTQAGELEIPSDYLDVVRVAMDAGRLRARRARRPGTCSTGW
jgi:hypothetical protein